MLEPLLMSKTVFDRLPRDQQAALMKIGADLEGFARKSAQTDDTAVAARFASRGGRTVDLNAASLRKWQDIARNTAWRDFGEKNANCAKLLALAEKTVV